MMDQNLIESFVPPVYSKTPRNLDSYRATYRYCSVRLADSLDLYRNSTNDQQTLRLIRDDMDNYLRRFHGYAIKENIGAHYREKNADQDCDFEHLVPASRVRDMMIAGVLTVDQVLNCPTVTLSRAKHRALKEAGWASHTPSVWLPFQRYTQVFDAEFETYDGEIINAGSWCLVDHYRKFDWLTAGMR
jgi:hypothetical protein